MFNILPLTKSVDVNQPMGLYIGQVGTGRILVELETGTRIMLIPKVEKT